MHFREQIVRRCVESKCSFKNGRNKRGLELEGDRILVNGEHDAMSPSVGDNILRGDRFDEFEDFFLNGVRAINDDEFFGVGGIARERFDEENKGSTCLIRWEDGGKVQKG